MTQQRAHFAAFRRASLWNSITRVYRIYIFPEELVFLEVWNSVASNRSRRWGLFGLLAGLLVGRTKEQPIAEKLKQLDEASPEELRRLAEDDANSFVATADELTDVRLDPPSKFLEFLTSTRAAGLLYFAHRDRGKFKLGLFNNEHMKAAYGELPRVLGHDIALNVDWNAKKQRFVKKQ